MRPLYFLSKFRNFCPPSPPFHLHKVGRKMRFTWNVSRAVCLLIAIRLWKALPCLLLPPTLPSSAQLRPTFKRRVGKGDYKATRVILQPYKVKSSASDRRLRFLTWLLQAILHGAWPYLRAVVYITGVCFVILDCPRTGLAIEKKNAELFSGSSWAVQNDKLKCTWAIQSQRVKETQSE